MGSDHWVYDEVNVNGDPNSPKIRIRLTYSYSDVAKFTSLVAEWDEEIDLKISNEDGTGYLDIAQWVEAFDVPFGGIMKI